MNWLDIVILVVTGILALIGWRNGIVRLVFGIGGTAVGAVLASRFYPSVADRITFVHNPNLVKVVAFAIFLTGVALVFVVAGNVLRKVMGLFLLGWVDRLAGMALGILVALVGFSALLSQVQQFPVFGLPQTIDNSALGSFLADNFDQVLKALKILPRGLG